MIEADGPADRRCCQALDANGQTDNTIVVFTSDTAGNASRHLAVYGEKDRVVGGGLRIPAIISWPARIPRGRPTDQVAISMTGCRRCSRQRAPT